MINYTILASEIANDPNALGLPALANAGNNDLPIASALNLVRTGASYAIDAGVIPAYQVINATIPADLASRSASQLTQYQILTGPGLVDTGNANVVAQFTAIFSGLPTLSALAALTKRQGSRAEKLFGSGTVLSHLDIARALGRG